MPGGYNVKRSPRTGRSIKEDGVTTNIADKTDEALVQSGYHIVPAATPIIPSTDKVFIAIRFPAGGKLTAVTDASILSGDATTVTYVAGDTHYGRVESYTADAITIAVEGV